MTKTLLATAVADKTGLGKTQARAAIDALTETIQEALARGDKVTLTGFGSFEVRERKARSGVKPGTSERIDIAASRAPAFRAGKGFKDSIK